MKKIILGVAVAAVAVMAFASAASASTPSHTPPAPLTTTHQLKAVVHVPGGDYTHYYTIQVNPLGGFTGVTDPAGGPNAGDTIYYGETVQGVLSPFGIAFTSTYAPVFNYTWSFVGSYKAGGAVLYQHDSQNQKWTVDFTVS